MAPLVSPAFHCVYCLDVLRGEPAAKFDACGHVFCEQCSLANAVNGDDCPRCAWKKPLQTGDAEKGRSHPNEPQQQPTDSYEFTAKCPYSVACGEFTSPAMRVHIRSCTFKPRECPNAHQGCRVTAVPAKMEDHLLQCEFQVAPCPFSNVCSVLHRDLSDHIEFKCQFRIVPCKYNSRGCGFRGSKVEEETHRSCGECQFSEIDKFNSSTVCVCGRSVPLTARNEHYSSCPESRVRCSCGVLMKRKEVDAHICPMDRVACDFADPRKDATCTFVGFRYEVEEHQQHCSLKPTRCPNKGCETEGTLEYITQFHKPYCDWTGIGCPNNCDAKLTQRDVSLHISVCPLQLVECDFKEHGCDKTIPRYQLKSHMKQGAHRHLHLVSHSMKIQDREVDDLKAEIERLRVMMNDGANLLSSIGM